MKMLITHMLKAVAVCIAISMPQMAQAFGGSLISTNIQPVGVTSGCNFDPYNDPVFQEAEISFFASSPGLESVGGAWWFNNIILTSSDAVTVSDLQTDCPFTNVVILSQNGADQASYAAEDLFELEWSATFNDDGQNYIYRIAMEGVSNTTVVNTRTLFTNNLPTADAGADQTVASAASVTLDGSASNANDPGQTLTYAWAQTGGTGVSLSDNTAESPTFTAPTLAIGDVDEALTFSLVVNDGFAPSSADTVVITVEAPLNTAPNANAGPDQTVASAANVTLDGSSSDPNDPGQTLTYSWLQTGGSPTVTLSNSTIESPTFTAPTLIVGDTNSVLTFELTVDDGFNGLSMDSVVITVEAPANTVPTANSGDNQSVLSEAPVTLDGSNSSANDAGQTLTYAWSQTSGTTVTLSDDTAVSPTFTAPALTIGDSDELLMFSLVVNDGFDPSPPSPVFVTVEAPLNTVPTADAGDNQIVDSQSLVTLDGSNSDANDPGQTLTYSWLQTTGPNVVLDDPQNVMPTFTAPTLAFGDANVNLIFQLNVDDAIDTSPVDLVTITVEAPPNTPPTANAGADRRVASNSLITLDGSASSANDPNQTLIYSWLQTIGPNVGLAGASTSMPTFTSPSLEIGDPDVTLVFAMAVNDGFETSTADAVEITVIAPQDKCAANPQNPVLNCSFETGDTMGWTVEDLTTPFLAVQVQDDGFSSPINFFETEATDGVKSLVHGFDGDGPGAIQIWQELTVVDEAQPILTIDYRAGWSFNGTLNREFYVLIEPVGGGTPLQSNLILTAQSGDPVNDTGPLTATVDLSDFADQDIRLMLFWDIPESFTGPAQFQIDNIEIKNSDLIFADGFDQTPEP